MIFNKFQQKPVCPKLFPNSKTLGYYLPESAIIVFKRKIFILKHQNVLFLAAFK